MDFTKTVIEPVVANGLAAEASTVHIRFPLALAVFLVVIPNLLCIQIRPQTLSGLLNV